MKTDNILKTILNKKLAEQQFLTGTVTTLSPLKVKLYSADDEINVVSTTNLINLKIGSRLLLVKLQNQFIALSVIGTAFQKNFIEITLTSSQLVTTTADTKINFDSEITKAGDLLTFTSNGIKIGEGIKTVKINLQGWGNRGATTAYFAMFIYLNSSRISYSIFPDRNGSATADTWSVLHNTRIINVNQNDIIYGYGKFSVADAANAFRGDHYRGVTMMVEVLEYE